MTIGEVYEKAHNKIYQNDPKDFVTDVEKAFEFENMPEPVKDRIHWMAWEAGHSAGYGNIVSQYFDLVELAKIIIEQQESQAKRDVR